MQGRRYRCDPVTEVDKARICAHGRDELSHRSCVALSTRVPDPIDDGASPSDIAIAANAAKKANDMAPLVLVLSVSGWAALAWMALDMGHPLVQLAMPASSNWTASN